MKLGRGTWDSSHRLIEVGKPVPLTDEESKHKAYKL